MQVSKKILQSKYNLFILFLLIIFISYYRVNIKKESVYKGSENEFRLTVIDKKYKDDKYTITFNGKEKIISYVKEFPYDVGDIVKVKGSLSKPKNNTIPSTFNYRVYLQSRGILWELNINEINIVKRNSNLLNKIKSIVINRINENKYKEYLYVYLLGDTSYFLNETRNIYQICGLSYLLSIGSIQIMMITKLLKKIEGKIKVKKKHSLIINIVVIIGYIIFVNGIIGVLRSGLCYIISSILKYYKIKYKYQNIIYIVGSLLLLINPYYITNIGFLYSFTISIIISLSTKLIKGSYYKRLFIISLIAFISSLPITIYFNYEINFLAIIVSIIFVPIFHFIIFPLSIIVFMFSFLSPLYYFLISFIEYIISLLSQIDIFIFVFRKPSMIVIIIYYLIIVSVIFNKKMVYLLIITLIIHHNINCIITEKIITFLDVGEGDSIVLKSNNQLYLLDTGGNTYHSNSANIIKYIKSLGISKIEYLILSHGDLDHMGEAINLVNDFKVEKVIFNCGNFTNLENELITLLDKKHIKKYVCIKELNFDNNKFIFLNTKEYDSENDNSSIIYTVIDGYKFLFMADAGKVQENDILNKYNLSNIDVLKVGHHGSKTSSGKEFINEVNPKYSIISVGKNNRYGHPNKEVLYNLKDSKIYRTDKDGSIMFKIKNNRLKIETCSLKK